MARRASSLSPQARDNLVDRVVANIQQAIYIHPGGYTTELVPLCDATTRFIGIPPVAGSWSIPSYTVTSPITPDQGPNDDRLRTPLAGFSQHLLLPQMPAAVELFRNDEFWFAFNTVCDTQVGAYTSASTVRTITLNPGLAGDTLAFTSVTNTGKLRVTWIQG